MPTIAPLPSRRISGGINVYCDVRSRRDNCIVERIEGLLMVWVGIAALTPPYALRAETELALGEKFDRLAFNNFLLDQGMLPPDLLAKAVRERFVPAQLEKR